MQKTISLVFFIIFSIVQAIAQATPAKMYDTIYNLFSFGGKDDPNAGRTTFLVTTIPMGGMAESIAMTTALNPDISFIELNPASSAVQARTQAAFFHNNWIADTKIESIVFSKLFNNISMAFAGKWLYVPFTEYDDFAGRVKSSYYSEVLGLANVGAVFFNNSPANLAIGLNAKVGYRSIPDYAVSSNTVEQGSGKLQSAFTGMVDIGILTKFNFLKGYSSRDKNFSLGLAIKNLGFPLKGDPLPTVVSLGLAYRFLPSMTLSSEVNFPFNLLNPLKSEQIYYALGFNIKIKNFWQINTGFLLKGRNPRLTIGASLDFSPLIMNINYTLDLTTQITPLNRISISAIFMLGSDEKEKKILEIDKLYLLGLESYSKSDLDLAIQYWEEVLKIDPDYEPAKTCLKAAYMQQELKKQIEAIQKLD